MSKLTNSCFPENNSNLQTTLFHETESLVSINNNQVVTSSLQVAKYFCKEHKFVLRAIRELECSYNFTQRNFAPCMYISKLRNGVKRKLPMYYLTRDGFTLLAMGFTGKVAAQFKEAYINAFNEMEEMLRSSKQSQYAEQLFRKQVKAFNEKMQKAIQSGRERHGEHYGRLAGELHGGLHYMEGRSFEDNLRNVFAQVNNAYLEGFFFASEMRKSQKSLDELKKQVEEFFHKMEGKIDLY